MSWAASGCGAVVAARTGAESQIYEHERTGKRRLTVETRAAFVHLLRAVYLSATCWGWNSLLQAAVDLGEIWNCKYCSGAKQRIVKFGGLLAAIKSCRGTAKGWDCGRHRAPERAA